MPTSIIRSSSAAVCQALLTESLHRKILCSSKANLGFRAFEATAAIVASLVSKLRKPPAAEGSRDPPAFENAELFPFQPRAAFARIGFVKFAATLLLLSAFALTACNNLVTRKSDYSPTKASGPYTEARRTGKLPTKEQLAAARATPKPERSSAEEGLLPNP